MDPIVLQTFDQIRLNDDFFEKAKLIDYLKIEKQIPLYKISQGTNIKPSYLCHILRLKKLPPLVVDGYYSKLISISHLFIISRLKDQESMITAYEKILSNSLTVSATEVLVREKLYNVTGEGEAFSKEQVTKFVEMLKNRAGFKVEVIQTRTKGKINLEIKGGREKTTPILQDLTKLFRSWLGETDY